MDALPIDTGIFDCKVPVITVTVLGTSLGEEAPHVDVTDVQRVRVEVETADSAVVAGVVETPIGRTRISIVTLRVFYTRGNLDTFAMERISVATDVSAVAVFILGALIDVPVDASGRRIAILSSPAISIVTLPSSSECAVSLIAHLDTVADACIGADFGSGAGK